MLPERVVVTRLRQPQSFIGLRDHARRHIQALESIIGVQPRDADVPRDLNREVLHIFVAAAAARDSASSRRALNRPPFRTGMLTLMPAAL